MMLVGAGFFIYKRRCESEQVVHPGIKFGIETGAYRQRRRRATGGLTWLNGDSLHVVEPCAGENFPFGP